MRMSGIAGIAALSILQLLQPSDLYMIALIAAVPAFSGRQGAGLGVAGFIISSLLASSLHLLGDAGPVGNLAMLSWAFLFAAAISAMIPHLRDSKA